MFTQLVFILISDRDSSLWVPDAVAEPHGSPVDLVRMRSHSKPRKYIPTVQAFLKSQSCRGNMRVLTGVPEHKAQKGTTLSPQQLETQQWCLADLVNESPQVTEAGNTTPGHFLLWF